MAKQQGPLTGTQTLTIGKALNLGLRRALEDDPKVLLMGEDVGRLGGVFRITDGLQKDFGEDRVLDSPLAEAGIVGTAIGLAMRGYRPVCEMQFDGFSYPAFDQVTNQLAKMHYRSRGRITLPVVIRIPFGGGIGSVEHHSESPETYYMHTAGLKVVTPSSAVDAYFMIQQAIRSNDPVIFLEPKARYYEKGEVDLDASLASAEPLHRSRVVRAGSDATVVGYGPTMRVLRDSADAAAEDGRLLELIDLRTLSPLDLDPVYESVKRTGRLIVVHEAPTNAGPAAEIAARVQNECFYSLEAPVQRVTGFDTPYPASKLEEHFLPDLDRVLDAVDRTFSY
ncbi:alpha-ketoacid dehydrogenase subunit beta [Actinocatenispora sera]|uniref:Pyruvate dehydrogenase E1 component subunit beta n=1 Tax=Actinocatenispora sera TaxID=390989 RepID=A0A810KUP8_9ACTN|nr:alpha-ketoacid dehydrogenase subunit beta [Actinocatenispora sera]BCJ26953.1 pyruvate dehydrogenase E1 component subunit beta [Actinocatenispora sera]